MSFYKRFQELCAEEGKSPTGVGLELGVHRSTVTYWKEGHTPKQGTLSKIAEYFDVPIDYLIGKTDNKRNGVNGDEVAKVALFGGDVLVTDEMWEEVKQYARFIAGKNNK